MEPVTLGEVSALAVAYFVASHGFTLARESIRARKVARDPSPKPPCITDPSHLVKVDETHKMMSKAINHTNSIDRHIAAGTFSCHWDQKEVWELIKKLGHVATAMDDLVVEIREERNSDG